MAQQTDIRLPSPPPPQELLSEEFKLIYMKIVSIFEIVLVDKTYFWIAAFTFVSGDQRR